jgi:hypothetical protein
LSYRGDGGSTLPLVNGGDGTVLTIQSERSPGLEGYIQLFLYEARFQYFDCGCGYGRGSDGRLAQSEADGARCGGSEWLPAWANAGSRGAADDPRYYRTGSWTHQSGCQARRKPCAVGNAQQRTMVDASARYHASIPAGRTGASHLRQWHSTRRCSAGLWRKCRNFY